MNGASVWITFYGENASCFPTDVLQLLCLNTVICSFLFPDGQKSLIVANLSNCYRKETRRREGFQAQSEGKPVGNADGKWSLCHTEPG